MLLQWWCGALCVWSVPGRVDLPPSSASGEEAQDSGGPAAASVLRASAAGESRVYFVALIPSFLVSGECCALPGSPMQARQGLPVRAGV